MKRKLLVAVPLLCVVALTAWFFRPKHEYLGEAYVSERSTTLLNAAKAMPVQARGRTKVQTNLRVEPGRTEPRLYQFGRGVPVEIVARSVADWVQVSDE